MPVSTQLLEKLIALMKQLLAIETAQMPQNAPVAPALPTSPSIPMKVTNEQLYEAAKAHLGLHLTLDPSVPPDLGCAECWSFVARFAGIPIPNGGFPGTTGIGSFIRQSGLFKKANVPTPGTTVLAETGTSTKGSPHGHVGIMGQNGWIMSNDSDTGLFVAKYTAATWNAYFSTTLGFPTEYWDLA